jgi:hypothetical protein
MDYQSLARDGLIVLSAAQGLTTAAIDLGRTHARNPLWLRHARFHTAWQSVNTVLLSVIQIAVLLVKDPYPDQRFYLVALLASVPMVGFLAAFVGRTAFGGTLSDPNGIPPVRIAIGRRVVQLDLNLAAVVVGLIALGTLLALYHV